MNKKTKICLNTMAGNEEHVVLRMLESCYKYIDYWVIQCNGTDKTQSMIEEFFKEKNIPGFTYNTTWKSHGWNRDDTVQKCLSADHGCDWILRVDCDEQLQVDDDFDWSIFDDTSVHSWNITGHSPGSYYFRTWMWNAKLPWRFYHDTAHERIYLPDLGEGFQRVNLPMSFKHILTNDGFTWANPTKFLSDALKLENQTISEGNLLENTYHFFYVGKSYNDCYGHPDFPLGYEHQKEYARRCIFYFEQLVKHVNIDYQDDMIYYAQYLAGNAYKFCKEYDKAIQAYKDAERYCPRRNEHFCGLAEAYWELGDYENMLYYTSILMKEERKNPFPDFCFLIHNGAYHDTGEYGKYLHNIALENV